MKLFLISLCTALGIPFLFNPDSPKELPRPKPVVANAPMGISASHSLRRGYVEWTGIEYASGAKFGDMVTISRKDGRVNAKYFASGSVSTRFSAWKRGKNVVTVCSGAFTEGSFGFQKPVGITIDNGKVINRKLDATMDGLVIVYATGGVAVSDLDNKYLVLDGEILVDLRSDQRYYNQHNKQWIYPLSYFLNWAQVNQATVFQTQLLIYKNEPQLIYHKARTELANRRFLILAKDFSGNLDHIIFNVCGSVYLGDASKEVFEYLRNKLGYDVIAMVNLDTGIKDHFKFYNDAGSALSVCKGTQPLSNCSNLIAYYFE